MKLHLISFQCLLTPLHKIMYTLAADPLHLSNLTERKIFQRELLINLLLMICKQFPVEIKQ